MIKDLVSSLRHFGDYQYSNDNFKFSLPSLGKNKYIRIKEQNDNDIYYLTNKG